MPAPARLHLIHHVLNAVPVDRWFSAWELAAVLYLDRGGPLRQQRCDVGQMLDLYASTPLIEARDDLALCRLYRKPEPSADEAWSDEQRATLASLRKHATRRFTADARRALPTLTDAALNLGREDVRRDDYTYAGEPKMKITPGRDDDTPEPDRDALACVSPVDPTGSFRLPGMLNAAKADRWWLKMLPYTGWQPRRTAFAAAAG